MNANQFQNILKSFLVEKLRKNYVVEKEWLVTKNSKDEYNREIYAPRVDLAIGPFNIDSNLNNEVNEQYQLNNIENEENDFIEILKKFKSKSYLFDDCLESNQNPRCLLAIEVVFSGSRKHFMGDIFNASILGYYGLIVAKDEFYEPLKKIIDYLKFAQKNNKLNQKISNIMLIKLSELELILKE